jgi:hypothetical protein
MKVGGAQRERERERLSIQQVTEGDWLTRAHDIKCTELPSYVPATLGAKFVSELLTVIVYKH